MTSILKSTGAVALLLLYTLTANATSLMISPSSIERVAPDRAAVFHLRNQMDRPISIKVRVFRWSQKGGGRETGADWRRGRKPDISAAVAERQPRRPRGPRQQGTATL